MSFDLESNKNKVLIHTLSENFERDKIDELFPNNICYVCDVHVFNRVCQRMKERPNCETLIKDVISVNQRLLKKINI